MEKLIDQLKGEHKILVEALTEIKSVGVGKEESKILLLNAKNALLSHIQKEDNELYPILRRAAQKDTDVKRKLEHFGKDMDEITQFVLNFYEKIESNSYTTIEYATDFGKMVALLSARISREENILYPLYETCLK